MYSSVTKHNINQQLTYCPSGKWVVATMMPTHDEYYAYYINGYSPSVLLQCE